MFLFRVRGDSATVHRYGGDLRSDTHISAIEEALGPEGFAKFWDKCGKTGGAGFAALDAITGEQLEEPGPPQPKQDDKDIQNGNGTKPWVPNKETLTSRDNKTIGISRGDMRAVFLGTFNVPANTYPGTLTFL